MSEENNFKDGLPEIFGEIQRICINGANEIRNKLRFNEDSFDFLGKAHNSRGRDYYLYAVLDEIERLGFAVLRLKEMLSDHTQPASADEIERRLKRNLLTAIHDEQSLYIRRLTELLIEVVCFSKTNVREYYDHYLLYKKLDHCNKRKEDLSYFYKCENGNIKKRIELLKDSITTNEAIIQLGDCWYLQKDKKTGLPKANGEAKLEGNFQTLLEKAFTIANRDERVALGLDYETAFRQPSRDIHLNIGGMKPSVTPDRIKARAVKFALLASLCLIRCRRLLGIRTQKGIVASLAKHFPFKQFTKDMYRVHVNPGISKGDFVIARNLNLLCEVIDTRKSKFGYKAFKVRFLQDHFLKEDWLIGPEIVLLSKGKKERQAVYELLEGAEVNPKVVAAKLRETTLELWQQLVEARNQQRRSL